MSGTLRPPPTADLLAGSARRDGWLVAVPLTPLVLVGLATTASIFGIPILLLALRPRWVALKIGWGGGREQGLAASAAIHLGLCVAVVVVTVVVLAVLGRDDLDSVEDAALCLVATVLVASLVVGALGLIRPVLDASSTDRGR